MPTFGQVPTTELLPGTECILWLGLRVPTLCLLGYDVVDQAAAECIKLSVGANASPTASLACVAICTRHLLGRQQHRRTHAGDARRCRPHSSHHCCETVYRLSSSKVRLLVVKDGPHCIPWTHAEEMNAEPRNFPGRDKPERRRREVAEAPSRRSGAAIFPEE